MTPEPLMEFDAEGVRRVARVLLNHVRPRTEEEARALIDGRLGGYGGDRRMLDYEINRYLGLVEDRAA